MVQVLSTSQVFSFLVSIFNSTTFKRFVCDEMTISFLTTAGRGFVFHYRLFTGKPASPNHAEDKRTKSEITENMALMGLFKAKQKYISLRTSTC